MTTGFRGFSFIVSTLYDRLVLTNSEKCLKKRIAYVGFLFNCTLHPNSHALIFFLLRKIKMKKETEATVAGAAGGVAGAAGAVGAVSALGTAGLSAAGITSGLATVGSIVGGGMAAGVVITATAPLAAAAAAYGLYKWLKD